MASPYERYMRSLTGLNRATAQGRRLQQDMTNGVTFSLSDNYKMAKIQSREHYDKNQEYWGDFEILVKHGLNFSEKKIATRPYVELPIGSYLEYDDDIVIVHSHTLGKQEVMPTYKAYICNHMLKLKGCPYDFPISSSNTGMSSQGVKDSPMVQLVDTRNKLYLQRNKYTVRLFEHHKNYRISINDGEVYYYYYISSMDDTTTPGLFTVTLKEDERQHLDGDYAFNEREIDFSDLNDTVDVNTGNVIEGKPAPFITCNPYQFKNRPFEVICNNQIARFNLSQGLEDVQMLPDRMTVIIMPNELGKQEITITDEYGQTVTKNIVVKEE